MAQLPSAVQPVADSSENFFSQVAATIPEDTKNKAPTTPAAPEGRVARSKKGAAAGSRTAPAPAATAASTSSPATAAGPLASSVSLQERVLQWSMQVPLTGPPEDEVAAELPAAKRLKSKKIGGADVTSWEIRVGQRWLTLSKEVCVLLDQPTSPEMPLVTILMPWPQANGQTARLQFDPAAKRLHNFLLHNVYAVRENPNAEPMSTPGDLTFKVLFLQMCGFSVVGLRTHERACLGY